MNLRGNWSFDAATAATTAAPRPEPSFDKII